MTRSPPQNLKSTFWNYLYKYNLEKWKNLLLFIELSV